MTFRLFLVSAGLKLPPATKPAEPNSHIMFINKSNRFVMVRTFYMSR